MTTIFPIVGVRHHVSTDAAEWIASLPEGTEVLLLPEPSNTFDRMAVQAYVNEQLVGYLSSDFLDLFHRNYPDCPAVRTRLMHHPYLDETSSFFIEISLETLDFPAYEPQVDTSPIADLPVPRFLAREELVLARLMNECVSWIDTIEKALNEEPAGEITEDSFCALLSYAEQFRPLFGHSLSGDCLRVYRQLYILLETSLNAGLSVDLLCGIFDKLQALLDIRTSYADSPEKCEQLFREELALVREEATPFLADYRRLLTSGTCSADQLRQEIDTRLRALPNQLYSLLNEPDAFAYRLLYMRLSSVELHTIMLLLICRDAIRQSQPTPEEAAKQRIVAFPYWDDPTAHEKQQAYLALREAARLGKNPAASLARTVCRLQKECVLLENIRLIDLGTTLNDLLQTSVNPDSFKRAVNRARKKY